MIQTDAGEIMMLIVSGIWATGSIYASVKNWMEWRRLKSPREIELRAIALRRVRQQGFLGVLALVIFMQAVYTVFLPTGDLQSAIRTYCLTIVCLMGGFRAAIDYLEQRFLDPARDHNGSPQRGYGGT